jgi:predicted phosphoribosyltransferase
MYFIDRHDAAEELATQLEKYNNEDGVILAVPRGGVPIGYYLAKYLRFALDLLMTKKLGHPRNEEYAIGAVGLEDSMVEDIGGISDEYVVQQTVKIRAKLKERYKKFMGEREPADIRGKVVIVVDDGIATGRTILATLKMLRRKQPKKLVVAVPVASPEAAERIKEEVDDFICLYTPSPFFGLSRFYQNFTQVSDEDVIALLKEFKEEALLHKDHHG